MSTARSIFACCRITMVLCLLLSGAYCGWSQSLEVPIDLQVPLFLKATAYDRAFASKLQKNGVIKVGICYQDEYRVSVNEMELLQEALSKPVAGCRIQVVLMAIGEKEDFEGRGEWSTLSVLYITSMRGLSLPALLAQTRSQKVLSICTQPALVPKGVTMGFELVGSRPKFVINRKSAIAEGCDFSSQLLKLATVY